MLSTMPPTLVIGAAIAASFSMAGLYGVGIAGLGMLLTLGIQLSGLIVAVSLGNLMIAPWARGQGVAQYLVGVMEQLARRDFAARELRVSCVNDNRAGLLLYARLGYRLSGLVERQRGQHRVALVQFVKELGS